jgi:hypothetical protein
VNLELPFYELPDAELDAYLDRIDRELDALFMDEVQGTLEGLRAEPAMDVAAVTAA